MTQAVAGSRIAELQDVVSLALEEARKRGATQCEVDASLNRGLTATVRLGEVDTVEYQRDRGLGVTVYFGKRKGSASTADLSMQAVRETVEKACTIARYTAEDPYAGLADPEALARDIPDLDLDHPWDADARTRRSSWRARCEAAGLAVDARLTNSEGASVDTQRDVRVYGNSHGFLAGYAQHQSLGELRAARSAGRGDAARLLVLSGARFGRPEPLESIGRKAAERALARLGARKLTTRKAPVIVRARTWRADCSAISSVRSAAQPVSQVLVPAGCRRPGRSSHRSCRSQERPHILKALASSPFDNEGVATRDRDLVRDGVLQGYVLGSYSARKLGLKTTGNAGGITI